MYSVYVWGGVGMGVLDGKNHISKQLNSITSIKSQQQQQKCKNWIVVRNNSFFDGDSICWPEPFLGTIIIICIYRPNDDNNNTMALKNQSNCIVWYANDLLIVFI